MATRRRAILAVVAGAVLWAVLWVGGTAGASAALGLAPGEPVTHTGTLLGYIAYSVVLSLLAGYVAAALADSSEPMTPVWWLAGLQLVLGILFEVSAWTMTPVWYHLVFLALVVPAVVLGGYLRAARASPDRA